MKILVLDDDASLLEAIRGILEMHQHEVCCVDDAVRAVETVKNDAYDVVLLDYKMPDHDGIWFMQNAGLPRETKVLLMTAYVNRDVIDRMFKLGVSGYIIKPFDAEDLMRHLEFLAGPSRASSPDLDPGL
jgi:DNA-binding response OmpR family regulator